jgi:hypothetical protein
MAFIRQYEPNDQTNQTNQTSQTSQTSSNLPFTKGPIFMGWVESGFLSPLRNNNNRTFPHTKKRNFVLAFIDVCYENAFVDTDSPLLSVESECQPPKDSNFENSVYPSPLTESNLIAFSAVRGDSPPMSTASKSSLPQKGSSTNKSKTVNYSSPEYLSELALRGVCFGLSTPSNWNELRIDLAKTRINDLSEERVSELQNIVDKALNESILFCAVLPAVVKLDSLLLNDRIQAITDAGWSDENPLSSREPSLFRIQLLILV